MTGRTGSGRETESKKQAGVFLVSSGFLRGSRIVASEEVDLAFGMPIGKLRKRAGIESLAYAAEGESELRLGARAAEEALRESRRRASEITRGLRVRDRKINLC